MPEWSKLPDFERRLVDHIERKGGAVVALCLLAGAACVIWRMVAYTGKGTATWLNWLAGHFF